MAQSAKNSRFPWLMFLIGFGVVFGIMFFNQMSSPVQMPLDAPADGVDQLKTVGENLIAISPSGRVVIREWSRWDANPRKIELRAERIAPASDEGIILVDDARPEWVSVVNADGEQQNRFSVGYGRECKYIATSSNGHYAALGIVDAADTGDPELGKLPIRLQRYAMDRKQAFDVVTITPGDSALQYRAVAVSDDGRFIACAGSKDSAGWIAVADTEQKKILWQKAVDFSEELRILTFSPDSETIFCSGLGHQIQAFHCQDGEPAGFWLFEKTDHVNVPQYTTDIAVTNDASLMAAGTEPGGVVVVWSLEDNKQAGRFGPGHDFLTGIAFSPDGVFLATGDQRTKVNKIFVWETPGR